MTKERATKNKILNPYFLFSGTFLVTLILYSLSFSDFNVKLGTNIILFLVLTIVLNFILYKVTHKKWSASIEEALKYNEVSLLLYRVMAVFFVFMGLLEVVYSKGVPLLGQINYKDYGIPHIHVIIVCCNSFFILVLVKKVFTIRTKKTGIIISLLLATLPLLLGLSRGTIVIIAIGSGMLYLTIKKNSLKFTMLLRIGFVLLVGVYLFGIAGNYRINHDYNHEENLNESSLILSIGKANEKFNDSRIPKPFFWTYIYITSPLSNFELNTKLVNVTDSDRSYHRYTEFIGYNFLPDAVSKKIYPNANVEFKPWLVTPEFTASSAFTAAYVMLGWQGIYFFLIYELIFPLVYLSLIKRFAKQYFDIAIVLVSTMYVLMPFANFFSFSALVFQLVIPFFCSVIQKIKFR